MPRSWLAYLWVSPVTLPALGLAALGWVTGGRVRIVQGTVESHGGLVERLLQRGTPWVGPIAAITLGHVILGRDAACLEDSRFHESVHVRQYERWGLLLIPLYLGASVRCWWRGLDPYRDNPFEIEAYALTAAHEAGDI